MSTLRMFIAIETDEETRMRARQAIKQLTHVAADVKWVEPENLHWTLQFLGEVDLTRSAEILRAAQEVTRTLSPFDITVGGLGAFPRRERPRTIWLGMTAGGEAMIQLQNKIETALLDLRFKPEGRRYQPHMTIGRVKGRGANMELAEAISVLEDFEAGSAYVDEVCLFSSTLERTGPRYEVLGRAGLGSF